MSLYKQGLDGGSAVVGANSLKQDAIVGVVLTVGVFVGLLALARAKPASSRALHLSHHVGGSRDSKRFMGSGLLG